MDAPAARNRIRTLIVDDSALVRAMVSAALARDPEIEVVGTAVDPYAARDKILQLDPDVITLDIEMPRMDGLTFLKRIMQHRPMPVVVMSSLTQSGSTKALEALQSGAVEIIAKPQGSFSIGDELEIVSKVKAAAQSRYRRPHGSHAGVETPHVAETPAAAHEPGPVPRPASESPRHYSARQIILIGASTGGTEAIKHILTRLPPDMPAICVVQHIPARFSAAFAERLNQLCELEVREAKRGDEIVAGRVLIAPGGFHLVLRWNGMRYIADLSDGPCVHHQRPAVDVMFDSALKAGAAHTTMAVLLTGMGADGAAGMLRLRQAGAPTIAQDQRSCVVFGMPREAIRMGAAKEILSLQNISARLERHASEVALRPVTAS